MDRCSAAIPMVDGSAIKCRSEVESEVIVRQHGDPILTYRICRDHRAQVLNEAYVKAKAHTGKCTVEIHEIDNFNA